MKNLNVLKGVAALAVAAASAVSVQNASGSIAQGSLMFTAVNTDGTGGLFDGFAVVALANIAAGEVMYITDNELTTTGATAFNTGESYSKWIVGAGGIAAGSVIRISNFDTTTIGVSGGAGVMTTLSFSGSSNRGLSTTADSLYLYQAASDATADTATTQIAYINIGNAVDGQISSSLNSNFATSITTGQNSAQYIGARSGAGAFSDYAPFLSNVSNWGLVALATDPNTFDATSFTITPTPGALALMGIGGLASTRRRRS